MSKPNGLIIYEGKSLLNGTDIVCILTGLNRKTSNGKTGDLVQSFIMPKNIHPTEAIRNGKDESVCGDCPARPINGGHCYVSPLSFNAVWKAYKNNRYEYYNPSQHDSIFENKLLRIGSWGDGAAVPQEIWTSILKNFDGHTAYTHQYKRFPSLKHTYMASVETQEQIDWCNKNGWRYFHVRPIGTTKPKGTFDCPASEKMGKKLTCEQCLSCHGVKKGAKELSVSIESHGIRKNKIQKVTIKGK